MKEFTLQIYTTGMQSYQEKDKQFIWHPYTSFSASPDPILIVNGKGVYLEDDRGNRYIDAISSWWVNIHGHGHPYIAQKIYEQALRLEHVIFAGFTHHPAIMLAERLLEILPGNMDKIFYSDNGSTAVEVGIKMALQYWWNMAGSQSLNKRTNILAFRNAYHGDTFGTMSVSERSIFTMAFRDKLFEVIFIDTPTTEHVEELRDFIRQRADTIAAFIYEPLLQGAGGMKMYEAVLLDKLLETCRQADIICIADEVMTGFGRTGRLFASDYGNENPDIMCLSKGLTGGTMALGATACTKRITGAFMSADRLKTLFHGHSFTANPLACSAALASLDLLQEKACTQNIETISLENRLFCDELSAYLPAVNARCCGTILAFELASENYNYLDNIGPQVTAFMLSKGIYLRPLGNTVYIMPPYCISTGELHQVYDAVRSFVMGAGK